MGKRCVAGRLILKKSSDLDFIKQIDLEAHKHFFKRIKYPDKIDISIDDTYTLSIAYRDVQALREFVSTKLKENPALIHEFEDNWQKDTVEFLEAIDFLSEAYNNKCIKNVRYALKLFYEKGSKFRSHFTSHFYPDGLLEFAIKTFLQSVKGKVAHSAQELSERIMVPRTESVGASYWRALYDYIRQPDTERKATFFRTRDYLVHGIEFKADSEKEQY